MSFDWIKIRTDLYRDPKVRKIADHLTLNSNVTVTLRSVTRNAVVGSLTIIWGVSRLRGKRDGLDLVLREATLEYIDELCDMPGFGAAMVSVGWLEILPIGLLLPRFFEDYNNDPAEFLKTQNAKRQKKFRDKKREEEKRNERNVTVTLQSNVEKRREEKRMQGETDYEQVRQSSVVEETGAAHSRPNQNDDDGVRAPAGEAVDGGGEDVHRRPSPKRNRGSTDGKTCYGEFKHVWLSEQERQRHIDKLGDQFVERAIQKLDSWIESKPIPSRLTNGRNANATFHSWVLNAVAQEQQSATRLTGGFKSKAQDREARNNEVFKTFLFGEEK
jgi:hypothetical protein